MRSRQISRPYSKTTYTISSSHIPAPLHTTTSDQQPAQPDSNHTPSQASQNDTQQIVYLSMDTAKLWQKMQSVLGFTSSDGFAQWMLIFISKIWPNIGQIPLVDVQSTEKLVYESEPGAASLPDDELDQPSIASQAESSVAGLEGSVFTCSQEEPEPSSTSHTVDMPTPQPLTAGISSSTDAGDAASDSSITPTCQPPTHFCSSCGQCFPTGELLSQHVGVCDPYSLPGDEPLPPGPPFTCSICAKQLTHKGNFIVHMRKHTGYKPYTCPFCLKKMADKLNVHLRTHTGEKPYTCLLCSRRFATKHQLRQHNYTHNQGGERVFMCQVCGKGFRKPFGLKEHMRKHTGERPHGCPFCPERFATTSTKNVHVRKHTGEKPYKCDQCDRGFVTGHQLKEHHITIHVRKEHLLRKQNQSHSGYHSCPLCDDEFLTVEELVNHCQQHDEKYRPLLCDICGKSFTKRQHLTAHRRTHTGEKPFRCEICGKSFSDPSACRRHVKGHEEHGVEYECGLCNTKVPTKLDLNRHLEQHTAAMSTHQLHDVAHDDVHSALVTDNYHPPPAQDLLVPASSPEMGENYQHHHQLPQHQFMSQPEESVYSNPSMAAIAAVVSSHHHQLQQHLSTTFNHLDPPDPQVHHTLHPSPDITSIDSQLSPTSAVLHQHQQQHPLHHHQQHPHLPAHLMMHSSFIPVFNPQ